MMIIRTALREPQNVGSYLTSSNEALWQKHLLSDKAAELRGSRVRHVNHGPLYVTALGRRRQCERTTAGAHGSI